MPSSTPAPDSIDRLAELLDAPNMPEQAMNLSMLDGFMAATLLVPQPAPLQELLPWIWDSDDGQAEPDFATEEEAEELLALLIQHWNDVAAVLEEAPEEYDPVFYQDDDETLPEIEDWCAGFVVGMQRNPEPFQALPDAMQDLLQAILLYGTEQGAEELAQDPPDDEEYLELVEAIPAIIAELRRHFAA